jgi:hypothetical protein
MVEGRRVSRPLRSRPGDPEMEEEEIGGEEVALKAGSSGG